jgi:uncharacterized membrane protein YvbJ
MYCPKCGVLDNEQSQYCKACGAKMDASSKKKSYEYETETGSKAHQDSGEYHPMKVEIPKEKENGIGCLIGIVGGTVLILVIVAAVVLLLLVRNIL